MAMSKSEAAARVRAGSSLETFHHATMGIFNVTGTRLMIKQFPQYFQVHSVAFADIKAEGRPELDAGGVVQWLIGQREVCPERCAELTAEQLEDPLINMIDTDGMVYIIDGIHRMAERFKRGMKDYSFYAVPVEVVPRLRPGTYVERPWGEMDVRDGQLVRRK